MAGALTAVGLLAVRTGIDTAPPGYDPPATAIWVGLTLALILPLALRRRFPLTVLVTITAVFFPYRIVDLPDLTVSVVVWWLALYSAGAYGAVGRRDWVGPSTSWPPSVSWPTACSPSMVPSCGDRFCSATCSSSSSTWSS